MKHVLTPTPIPPIWERAGWLQEKPELGELRLPKQERVPDPPEGYHKAEYGTAEFSKEREYWRGIWRFGWRWSRPAERGASRCLWNLMGA